MSLSEFFTDAGVKAELVEGLLRLSPKELVTPLIISYVKFYKKEIMQELSGGLVLWRNPYPNSDPRAKLVSNLLFKQTKN